MQKSGLLTKPKSPFSRNGMNLPYLSAAMPCVMNAQGRNHALSGTRLLESFDPWEVIRKAVRLSSTMEGGSFATRMWLPRSQTVLAESAESKWASPAAVMHCLRSQILVRQYSWQSPNPLESDTQYPRYWGFR